MSQAIVTKYLGATDFRGSRVRAKAFAGSIIVAWDYALNVEANHAKAAQALCEKYGWEPKRLVCGSLPDDTGYAFVLVYR